MLPPRIAYISCQLSVISYQLQIRGIRATVINGKQ